jgi:phosphatidylglycerol:prolipoprotein diacylglycerol transferase
MHQVLFHIPLPFGNARIPIYGYGVMLVVSLLVGCWLAGRRARKEGIHPDRIWDIGMWVFFSGVVGGRTMSMLIEPEKAQTWVDFFKIWQGGLVLYGSFIGGLIGYLMAYFLIVRKHGLSTLRIADICVPSIALGLFFGRIGCFLTGCCYGDVVDPARVPWATTFPANSPPHHELVRRGYQTAYGFILGEADLPPQERLADPRTIQFVEPDSSADAAGLRPGDVIQKVGDAATPDRISLHEQLLTWSSQEPLRLTVQRGKEQVEVTYAPPRSLPLHPTQLYMSLDGLILFLFLSAYYPFRRRPGEVMALFMICYGIDRFLIEKIRLDNPPDYLGLTYSQWISVLLFAAGVVQMTLLRRPGRAALRPRAAENRQRRPATAGTP